MVLRPLSCWSWSCNRHLPPPQLCFASLVARQRYDSPARQSTVVFKWRVWCSSSRKCFRGRNIQLFDLLRLLVRGSLVWDKASSWSATCHCGVTHWWTAVGSCCCQSELFWMGCECNLNWSWSCPSRICQRSQAGEFWSQSEGDGCSRYKRYCDSRGKLISKEHNIRRE